MTTQSCVYREYSSGGKMQPYGAPVLRVREDVVWLLPILTNFTKLTTVRWLDSQGHRAVQTVR